VPAGEQAAPFSSYADRDWIVNSRNTADTDVLRTLASMAGFVPRVVHRIDSLELVDDLIVSGHGIGLLPHGRASRRGVRVLPLSDPPVVLRAYAVTRRGRDAWPPLRVLLERLAGGQQ
jgi:DNA-binding transcriptional LysR family regulator